MSGLSQNHFWGKFLRVACVLIVLAVLGAGLGTGISYAVGSNTQIGMWYATWYAKVPEINTNWISNFGTDGSNHLIGDVNGDGKEDAVVFKSSDGAWQAAVSNGNGFNSPSQWTSGHGAGSNAQFLADCNGDGKQDAVVFFSSSGNWYVATSTGNGFNNYSLWKSGHGANSTSQMLADCNGDGKADAVAFFGLDGSWYMATSSGSAFNNPTLWKSGHGAGSSRQFMGDLNKDSKADAVVFFSSGDWYAAYSTGSSLQNYFHWTTGHGAGSQNQLLTDANGDGYADPFVFFSGDINGDGKSGDWYGRKNNKASGVYPDEVFNSGFGSVSAKQFQSNVTGDAKGWKASVVYEAATGTWKVERYHFFARHIYNTWQGWNIKYVPYTLGSYQTYDSGDSAVIDEHLSMCADAKVDFLLLDETNNLYVDEGYIFERAKALAARVRTWNANAANRDVKYAVAIGGIQFSQNPATLEWEAGEVWKQFANTVDGGVDNYYHVNGKPLLVVYCTPSNKTAWQNYTGDKTNSGRFSLRWAHSPSEAGTYGWEVRNGTVDHDEVMVVMPGWNNNKGVAPVSRSNGDYYTLSCWDKVLTKASKPQIVVINSFNEYAEETAVAPTDTANVTAPTEKWYNKSGQLDNHMYWNMTKEYINALLNGNYKASKGFSGGQGWHRWYYQQWNGTSYSNMTWDTVNNRWHGSQTYCQIMQSKQHPDTNDSVRKWVAPYAGTVKITGTVKKENTSGNGVDVTIKKNSSTVWGTHLITTTSGMAHDITVTVSAGDSLYFIVNRNGDNAYDTTLWDPEVTYQ